MAELYNSSEKKADTTNPSSQNVILRDDIAIDVTTPIAMGYGGGATVDLRDKIEAQVTNPVIFMYEYELFAAASHTLTPVPYARFDNSGVLARRATFNLYNLADGTMSLQIAVQSTAAIYVKMYYVVYSTRVADGFIFNP